MLKRENSAEARAIARIATIDKDTDWLTLMEPDEPINIEAINKRLRERGYKTQIPDEPSRGAIAPDTTRIAHFV